MEFDLDSITESLERLKQILENDTNYAVLWLNETIDFLNNEDLNMALWSFGKYLEVLEAIDFNEIKNSSEFLKEKLTNLKGQK